MFKVSINFLNYLSITLLDKTTPNFESFLNKVNQILSLRNPKITEIDHRYTLSCKKNHKEPNLKIQRLEKIQEIGKLYVDDNYTVFDFKKGTGSFILSNNNHNLTAVQANFPSVMTLGSCVTKGKWCYEIQLISYLLRQIGWTTLHTKFSETIGLGDEPTSYGFDGYRRCSLNVNQVDFGELWDSGN